jgi:glycogen phosphorylase
LLSLSELNSAQLNDTHPSIGIPELVRLLVDEHNLEWEVAWKITTKFFAYTNHTLLSEALETWPVELFSRLLPRHLEIIYEINRRFLDLVRARYPHDESRVQRMSLIEEGAERRVRMAHLATVGSHAVNGVAELHTKLLCRDILHDFHELWPEKFHNVTNGITPRRWLMLCNPKLAFLISEHIGRSWVTNLAELRKLEAHVEKATFRETWKIFKDDNKRDLSEYILHFHGIKVDPDSMFDIQVKRLHEYKRQLLSVLHIIHLYRRLKDEPQLDIAPRTFIFGAKAAPGYSMAKLIIKLINSVADVVNADSRVSKKLKVVFLSNFCVSLGERVYPAADLSEQISLAGKEASGTGNMKFSLNGALTIGTLDGANIEIREAVGPENFFMFGLTVEEVRELWARGYSPREYYEQNLELRAVIDLLAGGHFSNGDHDLFQPIVQSLLFHDEYMLFADFAAYTRCQAEIGEVFCDADRWTRMSVLNVARMGKFSSDRSIREYCDSIWAAVPLKVSLDGAKEGA